MNACLRLPTVSAKNCRPSTFFARICKKIIKDLVKKFYAFFRNNNFWYLPGKKIKKGFASSVSFNVIEMVS